MKLCNSCKQTKELFEFNKKRSGHQPYCRSCDNYRSRERYKLNSESHKKAVLLRNQKRRLDLQTQIRAAKSVPCMDCNTSYPYYVMDFDHVSGVKLYNISELIGRAPGDAKLKAEIEKCEVVCSNCHRIRTHNRQSQVTQLAE